MFNALKPLIILVACFYGFGSKAMDGYRPNKLDMPIKGFHHDVNAVFTLLQRSADAIIFEAGASNDPFQIAGRSMTAIGREIRTTNRMKVWM